MDDVTLLDIDGTVIGSASKHLVHTADTPLHLGFSCHLVDGDGRVLVTRRALGKLTWPGVWTNSFCGHPAPGEAIHDAVHRRASEELGAVISDLRTVLPDYRYRAVDASGIVENEHCPVHVAVVGGEIAPVASEVAEWAWTDPATLVAAVRAAPYAFSPWMREQLELLRALGEV
ncbi:isopentenyl-diphosphate Delta-isomerase [Streptomyces sp. AC495_CC817]|uniref:isopentenyl-diphosphate Delta-isomerase n=1 Tax=Streptomyces sp. AC495_CC817 TaxID=2823900 RepID=UPI001C259E63|nr:isopentenyl-diphosphate Delta-isomerase [Streptomyces sp. AC495_CC817]